MRMYACLHVYISVDYKVQRTTRTKFFVGWLIWYGIFPYELLIMPKTINCPFLVAGGTHLFIYKFCTRFYFILFSLSFAHSSFFLIKNVFIPGFDKYSIFPATQMYTMGKSKRQFSIFEQKILSLLFHKSIDGSKKKIPKENKKKYIIWVENTFHKNVYTQNALCSIQSRMSK